MIVKHFRLIIICRKVDLFMNSANMLNYKDVH